MTSNTRMAVLAVVAVALSACGGAGNGGSGSGSSASAVIGASGGAVTAGGVTLSLSAGALSKETEITVSELPGDDGRHRIELEPKGLALSAAAKLSVRSDDGNAHDERLVELDDSSGTELERSITGEVENEVEHAREAEIEHLGTFEDRPARTCTPACGAGLECDDGTCKAHGGGSSGG